MKHGIIIFAFFSEFKISEQQQPGVMGQIWAGKLCKAGKV